MFMLERLKILELFPLLTPRAPSNAESVQLRRRLDRLRAAHGSIKKATDNMANLAAAKPKVTEVRIRRRFVRRAEPAPGSFSDRSLPPRHLRPPATRLVSPRGASLRFYLTALFEAQTSSARPGTHPVSTRLLKGSHERTGWDDLLASPAQNTSGNVYMNVAAKKRRQLNETLGRLHQEELVALPNADAGSNKCEGFQLMDEGGWREEGPNDLYLLPKSDEAEVFAIPITFFAEGWIHCLEDTELAFILMIASCGAATAEVKIEGEERLLHYGFGRDAYDAHIMFNRLGLIEVRPDPDRHADGKVPGDPHLHSFKLLPAGFETSAFTAVTTAITETLEQGEGR